MSCHGFRRCPHHGHCDLACHDEVDEKIETHENEIASLKKQLADSDAIRGELVKQTAGLARDMVIALEMLEAAYSAGYILGTRDERTGSTSMLTASFKQWFADARVRMPKPGST